MIIYKKILIKYRIFFSNDFEINNFRDGKEYIVTIDRRYKYIPQIIISLTGLLIIIFPKTVNEMITVCILGLLSGILSPIIFPTKWKSFD